MHIRDNIYILNPEYRLKVDKNRIIFYYRRRDPPLRRGISNFLEFLHPIFSLFLALFDGKKTIKKVSDEFIYLTGFNQESLTALTAKLMCNQQEVQVDLGGHNFYFPKNTLIPADTQNINSVVHYNPADFLIPNNQLDFKTQRFHTPLDTHLAINNICAAKCIYCYLDHKKNFNCQIPLPRLKELIREARNLGMRDFNISGGEVFNYKHWKEVMALLVEKNFDPFISTKYPITERRVKELMDAGIKRMQISLDTIDKDEMIKMWQVSENYHSMVLKGLELLDKNGIEIRISSMITNINQESIPQLLNHLLQYPAVQAIHARAIGFSRFIEENAYHDMMPSKQKLAEIKDLMAALEEQHGNRVKMEYRNPFEKEDLSTALPQKKKSLFNQRSRCSGNFFAFDILADGKVTICEEMFDHPQFIIGDLMTHSIEEVWNSEKALAFHHLSKDKISDDSACKSCAEFTGCHEGKGVCWKLVLYAYGDDKWDQPDPRCHLAPPTDKEFWIKD